MSEMVCRYCNDEFCVNDQCPMRADYCPVPDTPGVCRHEDRINVTMSPKECLMATLDDNGFDTKSMDGAWNDFVELMAENGHVIVDINVVEFKPKTIEEIREKVEDANDKNVDVCADKPKNYERTSVDADRNLSKNDECGFVSEDKREKFYVGQRVSIGEIANSHEWVFDRKVKDHDIHESIIYITRDRTLTVSFDDDNKVGVVMPKQDNNSKKQEKCFKGKNIYVPIKRKSPKFQVGQKVHIDEIRQSKDWVHDATRKCGHHNTEVYVTLDRTLKLEFNDWERDECGYIELNQNGADKNNSEKFYVGQELSMECVASSDDWTLKSFSSNPFDNGCTYINRDKTMIIVFEHGKEGGIVEAYNEFVVGQRVHVGAIGASKNWRFAGEINGDTAYYESVDGTMSAAFVNRSDWATIMRLK